MLVQVAALLAAAAAGPAGASMVSMMKDGELTFCVKQPCFAPNVCLPFLGVNTCVRTNTPKCSNIKCPPKFECALLQDVCDTLPCHPKPYCVKYNPCGICLSPDHFCELLPTPTCRHVVEPTCLNKKCGFGEMCRKEPLECVYPPCRVKFSCVPTWPHHYVPGGNNEIGDAGSVFGATKSGASGAFGAGGSYGAFGAGVPYGGVGAGAGGAGGGSGGGSGSSYSYEPFSGGPFSHGRPISHAAGAISPVTSAGGGSSVAGEAEEKRKKAGPKNQHESANQGNESDTDTDDDEE